jgi:hypothetical protein
MINFHRFKEILENKNQDLSKRDGLLMLLQQKFPGEFIKTSEEFSQERIGGIWITGKNMADYYGKDNSGFDYWINPKLQTILKKHSFYLEPYDPETWFAWPDNPLISSPTSGSITPAP